MVADLAAEEVGIDKGGRELVLIFRCRLALLAPCLEAMRVVGVGCHLGVT